jgi:Cu-processing system ATP-binding protein
MIEINNLSKKFGRLQVLKNINLNLLKGECIALIGPNGCGKTTLIKSILGMVIPNEGEILFNQNSIYQNISYRAQIGYMPQIGRYPENMSIGQIIDMVKEIRQSNTKLDEDLYHQFKINQILDKKMRTLSGGTTQKVSATLAFLFNPSVLILDEPTAGLDPLASEILKDKIIQEKKNGKLILITSHLLSELDDLVSQIVFMQEGVLVFHKNVTDLKKETGIEKLSKAITHILKDNRHE